MDENNTEPVGIETIEEEEYFEEDWGGVDEITIRDFFAGQALPAIVDAMEDEMEEDDDFGTFAIRCAQRSYILADAMMLARDIQFIEVDEDEETDEEEEGADEEAENETPEE